MAATRTSRRPAARRRREASERARDWLRRNKLRCTGPRLAMVTELLLAREPVSLAQLHERVADEPCDFATVFRFVERLRESGLVRAHFWGERQAHFELAEDSPALSHEGHHHHLVCRRCRAVLEVHACGVEAIEKAIAKETGFSGLGHSLEFFGLCPDCQKKAGN